MPEHIDRRVAHTSSSHTSITTHSSSATLTTWRPCASAYCSPARGPKVPFAILKLPGKGRNSDHFWRKGNLACDIDPQTGLVLRARTKDPLGTTDYTDHPETGTQLVGETLPLWDDVLALAHACSLIFAPVRYQSMDVAITPDGPMLIEINTGGGLDLPQLASGRGFLTDEVQEFFSACGIRPWASMIRKRP